MKYVEYGKRRQSQKIQNLLVVERKYDNKIKTILLRSLRRVLTFSGRNLYLSVFAYVCVFMLHDFDCESIQKGRALTEKSEIDFVHLAINFSISVISSFHRRCFA